MSVQTLATERNGQAELLVDFILRQYVARLHHEGCISRPEPPTLHYPFERDDCSDVFDHYVELELTRPVGDHRGRIQIWAQTTCYKGNATGKPEPNKTYEIRETLTEALGLRRWLREEQVPFRTVHFTIGPASYTYGWFKSAKGCAFDLSLYPGLDVDSEQLFDELSDVLGGVTLQDEAYDRLGAAASTAGTQIAIFVQDVLDQLCRWFVDGLPSNVVADQQADLLDRVHESQRGPLERALPASRRGGENIKRRALALLRGGEDPDTALRRTVKRLTQKNPFLPTALEALVSWDSWSRSRLAIPDGCGDLARYVRYLWNRGDAVRLIVRRLLLRVHTDQGVDYIQDLDIPDLTEHNLYSGTHGPEAVEAVVQRIVLSCLENNIKTPTELFEQLVGERGRDQVRGCLQFEMKNGTEIRPSFIYVEESLSDRYAFVPFRKAKMSEPTAYHASFGGSDVNPYQNMKVVVSKVSGRPVAIVKAKFFNRPEFPRRAKEEAYVGLTSKYKYDGGAFRERYPGIPMIMFVDMDRDVCPPEYAVTRLVTAGWEAFFSIDALRLYLDGLTARREGR